MIEQDLVAYLGADAGISTGLGGDNTRISPLPLPESAFTNAAGEKPWLTYHDISAQSQYTQQGRTGPTRTLLQIDCWAKTYADCTTLSTAVLALLDGFSGAMGASTVQLITSIGPSYQFELERKLHRKIIELTIWFSS